MSNVEKLLKNIENNPKNVRMAELKKLLEWYGYELVSINGSHHKFKKDGISIIVPYKKPIKEIYIKQVLQILKDNT